MFAPQATKPARGRGLVSAAVGVLALFVAGKPAPASAMFVPILGGGALVLAGRL